MLLWCLFTEGPWLKMEGPGCVGGAGEGEARRLIFLKNWTVNKWIKEPGLEQFCCWKEQTAQPSTLTHHIPPVGGMWFSLGSQREHNVRRSKIRISFTRRNEELHWSWAALPKEHTETEACPGTILPIDLWRWLWKILIVCVLFTWKNWNAKINTVWNMVESVMIIRRPNGKSNDHGNGASASD